MIVPPTGTPSSRLARSVAAVESRGGRIGTLGVSPVEIELSGGVLRVVRVHPDKLEVGSELDVMTFLEPVQLILPLPGILWG